MTISVQFARPLYIRHKWSFFFPSSFYYSPHQLVLVIKDIMSYRQPASTASEPSTEPSTRPSMLSKRQHPRVVQVSGGYISVFLCCQDASEPAVLVEPLELSQCLLPTQSQYPIPSSFFFLRKRIPDRVSKILIPMLTSSNNRKTLTSMERTPRFGTLD